MYSVLQLLKQVLPLQMDDVKEEFNKFIESNKSDQEAPYPVTFTIRDTASSLSDDFDEDEEYDGGVEYSYVTGPQAPTKVQDDTIELKRDSKSSISESKRDCKGSTHGGTLPRKLLALIPSIPSALKKDREMMVSGSVIKSSPAPVKPAELNPFDDEDAQDGEEVENTHYDFVQANTTKPPPAHASYKDAMMRVIYDYTAKVMPRTNVIHYLLRGALKII
jgi:hypothetical protein